MSRTSSARSSDRSRPWRTFAAWLGAWLLLVQTAVAGGLIERPMAPSQEIGGMLVICTEHGAISISDDRTPGHLPANHSLPSCPCCLPFTGGHDGAILADALPLPAPAWSGAAPDFPSESVADPRESSQGPQQPRAPPHSV